MDLVQKITEILYCSICEGKGISNEWLSSDGDYDFEWCDCNPDHLVIDGDEVY